MKIPIDRPTDFAQILFATFVFILYIEKILWCTPLINILNIYDIYVRLNDKAYGYMPFKGKVIPTMSWTSNTSKHKPFSAWYHWI